jgi:uncharacterized protein
MKKIALLFAICTLGVSVSPAQEIQKKEHSIKVIGTAELEIVPDQMFVSVTLKEYMKDKKKMNIEELEKNFVNFVEKTTATDKKDIKMNNLDACMISMKRKKNKDEVITKNYTVKYKNAQQVYQLFSVMDSLGISGAYVSKYSHSKMDEYKKQVKVDAIKAAQEKAAYLLAAIGEKMGKAITVTENSGFVNVDDGVYRNRYDNYSGNVSNSYSQSAYHVDGAGAGGQEDAISEKTIKLHYEINAEFEIQ